MKINTKLLMTSSAALLGLSGLILTFLPEEFLSSIYQEPNRVLVLLMQGMGALYFAFGILNWMSKNNRIGGIYSRPLIVGNLTHFMMVSITLLKFLLISDEVPMILKGVTMVYSAHALLFGFLMFKTPKLQDREHLKSYRRVTDH